MKSKIDLSGIWDFMLDAEKEGIEKGFFEKKYNDTISLPGTTSQQQKGEINTEREIGTLTDIYKFEGYAWFRKKVSLDGINKDSRVFLYLERTRITTLWVNCKKVGSENSLTAPQCYDITDFINFDKNEIEICIMVSNVDYPTRGGHLTSPDTQTNWNGIVGEISLRVMQPVYIESVKTYPDIEEKQVKVKAKIKNTTSELAYLRADVTAILMDVNGYIGNTLGKRHKNFELPAGETTEICLDYNLGSNPEFWSEHNPKIYELKLSLENGEYMVTHFGLRKFSTTSKRFLINGNPTFLRGKHDGLVFPLTGAFPTDLSSWLHVMGISKSYGINHYRYHTCCPPEAAFLAADLLGIYMEPQLPFWGTLNGPEDEYHNHVEHEYLVEQGYKMLDAFGNHASFCMMSLGNELWGNKDVMNDLLHDYKTYDNRHLYTQGSNNFQHAPLIVKEDDFYVGVRLAPFDRHFRGSYGMCDTPLGHIQTDEPGTMFNYDEIIHPSNANVNVEGIDPDAEIEIQYGTGVKKVKASEIDDELLIPKIPVVSHEIGQYTVYPNFREIDKYTGSIKAKNFEIFKERLDEKGMLDEADDFFMASGKFAVECYKEELESAARSDTLAGYQILDIQDFQGQGTALVGILDAFMDSKGLVSAKDWRGYCSDTILMALFDSYVLKGGSEFHAETMLRYYKPYKLSNAYVHWSLKIEDIDKVRAEGNLHPEGQFILSDGYRTPDKLTEIASGDIKIPDGSMDLVKLAPINVKLPNPKRPYALRLTLSINNMEISNSYELWLYPDEAEDDNLSPIRDLTLDTIRDIEQVESEEFRDLPFGALKDAPPAENENATDESESSDAENSDGEASDSSDAKASSSDGDASDSTEVKASEAADTEIEAAPVVEYKKTSVKITAPDLRHSIIITNDLDTADTELRHGNNVLLLPYEVTNAIRGFYCTDFWCYSMFRDICNWMKKPIAIGTMGLLIQNTHPVFKNFPTLKYQTPQWYKLVSHSDLAVLDDVTDDNFRPIVQMIDNFDRNHKLGLLFEGHTHSGKLMVCTARLSEIVDEKEVTQFVKSLMGYVLSEAFDPAYKLDFDKLRTIFR
ncbi:MAG: beta-glucuronidase [Lachnospiraceae bacterium]|nr:beta-glucuronidase [Lachnospiraceae bacterium]